MSKERLEEIKKRLVLLRNAIDVDDETKNYIFKDLKVEWLIERVRELEEKLHFCEMSKLSMDSVEKYTEQIKSKNKRYHEALVKLRNDIGKIKTGYEKNVFVIKTVDDALIDWEALGG